MSKLSYVLARAVCVHHMRVMWISAAVLYVLGLSGPKYGGSLAHFGLLTARFAVPGAVLLMMVIAMARKRRSGLRLQDLVANYAIWQQIRPATRATWTIFFIGLAVMFICLGALIGSILVYLTWRII